MLFLFSLEFLKEKLLLKKLLLFPTFIFFKGFVLDCLSVHSIFFLGIFFLSSLLFLTHSLFISTSVSLFFHYFFSSYLLPLHFSISPHVSPFLSCGHSLSLFSILILVLPHPHLHSLLSLSLLFSLLSFFPPLPHPFTLSYLSLSLSFILIPPFPLCMFVSLSFSSSFFYSKVNPSLSLSSPPPFFLSIPFVYLIMSPLRRFVFAG